MGILAHNVKMREDSDRQIVGAYDCKINFPIPVCVDIQMQENRLVVSVIKTLNLNNMKKAKKAKKPMDIPFSFSKKVNESY